MIWYVVLYFVLCTYLYYFYRANDNLQHNWKDIIKRFLFSFTPILNILILIVVLLENIKPPKPPRWL